MSSFDLACYCIDLDKSLEILEFSGEALREDMAFYNASTPLALTTPDRRVFASESEAAAFLALYKSTLEGLSNKRICLDRELPGLLYKRRYIVLSVLGLKNKTVRHYKKAWKPGDLFNLYDQTFFLTVRLTDLKEVDGMYHYHFELAR